MKTTVKIFSVIAAIIVLFTACDENFIFPERPLAEESIIIPVEHITGIPIGSRPGLEITLSGIVAPENATNKRIVWSLTGNGAGATLVRNKLSTTGEGNVTVTATIKDGLGTDEDYTQNFNIIISVTMIAVASVEVPSTVTVGGYELNAVFTPSNALYKTIKWSVKDAGTTGAEINGSILTTTAMGTAILTAFIANGKLNGDYIQDFEIEVIPFVPVTEITGISYNMTPASYNTLKGIVSPSDATYKTIKWSVKDVGTTGAEIHGNLLQLVGYDEGTLILTATIANGVAFGEDYTQDFTIEVHN